MGDRLLTTNWSKYQLLYSDYKWPITIKPSTADWQVWNSTLVKVFQVGQYQKILIPRGPYLGNNGLGWFYDPVGMTLWFSKGDTWTWHRKNPCAWTLTFRRVGQQVEPPITLS